MKRILFFLGILILTFVIAHVIADVPRLINYQGVLLNSSEQPVAEGNYKMTFRLYDESGTLLWTEVQNSVFVAGGMFNVILGSVTPLALPFDKPYLLGVQVGSDPELQPRMLLTSAAYAIRADDADRLLGYTVSPTPKPNALVPLDSTGKFPTGVLAGGAGTSGVYLSKNTPDTSRVTSAAPVLLISNQGTGMGLSGRSKNTAGLEGRSESGNGVEGWTSASDGSGVFGMSTYGKGVTGRSDNNDGVVGWTGASEKSGVFGHSTNGYGVNGQSARNHGVYGYTTSNDQSYAGVYGFSVSATGVKREGKKHERSRRQRLQCERKRRRGMDGYERGWRLLRCSWMEREWYRRQGKE